MLGLLGSSASLTSTPSGICPMAAKPLFLGLFCPPKPFEDRVSLQGTWSAVMGRKALNLSCPKVKLCREAAREPSRDKPLTFKFVGSSILESGCWIAGRLVVAILTTSSTPQTFVTFVFFKPFVPKWLTVCARVTRVKLFYYWLSVSSTLSLLCDCGFTLE